MYTSDTDKKQKQSKNRHHALSVSLVYLFVAAFCALFGIVYECFSHEVYSPFMMFAFLIPLILGSLVFAFIAKIMPDAYQTSSSYIWHSAVATLTVGCIIRGVLEIYGTQNPLLYIYPVCAIILFLTAIGVWLKNDSKRIP